MIEVNRRIAALTGLDMRHGEPIQGQRYEIGQEFKAHTDYFEPNGADFERFCSFSGQRTWTVTVLPEPGRGRRRNPVQVDRQDGVHPETGKVLAWNNLRPDSTPNPSTLHHAMKVRAGLKYVLTKWFRERPWGWEGHPPRPESRAWRRRTRAGIVTYFRNRNDAGWSRESHP